ncbi:phosphate ABC transporter membrane protein 2, PhoT family [Flavobacterium glycines]|jgi:phosphate transport system permease protein|uniref:Phosphate transport system permease protein PstA n=1 Tax=Flavobacterium glycines TaxID=551990 RepID=A0A511CFM8_9FLAO|nr:phosphate ABC transporter permease PstA [Flavobacterium glycines]GEL10064.1 phosphate transport system permease protein PstA [Flavobacterium glycines]SDI82857.1 phosphate ABC transporter membrane protein 2, PhoT family [Flavobacterium glycines]
MNTATKEINSSLLSTQNKNTDIKGKLIVGVTQLAVFTIIAVLFIILGIIVYEGREKFSWEFISSFPTNGMTEGGIFPALIGTFILVIVMSIAAVPFGTITAIYLTEYASESSKFAAAVRFSVRTLAVVPSIIFGLFGLGFFIQFIGAGFDTAFNGGQLRWGQPNILWASLTMSLLTLPVIIVSVEEALKTIPRELREASLALGATKWQTIKNVVLPGSISGIMTGTILAVSRGAGEVAPILFTGAAYYLASLPGSLSDQFMNLGYHIYIMATQSSDVEKTMPIQFATTLVLLILTLSLNLVAVVIRSRIRRKAK